MINIMNNKQKFQILLNISIYACILFISFSGFAMYFYPGGTMRNNPFNPNFDESLNLYSHSMNFFSEFFKKSSKNIPFLTFLDPLRKEGCILKS